MLPRVARVQTSLATCNLLKSLTPSLQKKLLTYTYNNKISPGPGLLFLEEGVLDYFSRSIIGLDLSDTADQWQLFREMKK